jgi:acetyltransferase-like isoleucine patch superfamily enzyme
VGLIGYTTIDNRSGGNISIGANCGFSSVVISSKIGIKIGNRVMVGGNARIFDHDFHSLRHDIRWTRGDAVDDRAKLVTIDDDCFIGTNAIILKGTHLGARSIVAAGSVVFGLDVPPDSIVKGNPACVTSKKKVHTI